MGAAILEALANYNPTGFAQGNTLRDQAIQSNTLQQDVTRQDIAAKQLQNTLMQRQMRDADIITQAYLQSPTDPRSYMLKNGISGPGFLNWQQGDLALKKSAQDLYLQGTEGQQKIAQTNHQLAGEALNGVQAAPAEQKQDAWARALPTLKQLDPNGNYPDQYPGDPTVNSLLAAHGYLDKVYSQAKTQAETAKAAAEGTKAQAETTKATAEGQIAQIKADAMKQFQANPQAGSQQIDAILPASVDPQANAAYKAAFGAAMQAGGPDAAKGIIEAAAHHAGQISYATNPQVRAAEVQKSVDTARATAGIEIGKAIATAKALRQGDNPAVAGVPPAAVGQVQNQAIKLDQDYINAKATTDAMGKFLDLAEHGNKAAGSNLPLVGVETVNAINGIKRINSAEISQYGNAGSLLDQIKGKIGKLTVGQPVPQDVMNDIRELHQTLGQEAYQKYTSGLDSLNQRTGAKFQPTVAAPDIRKPEAQLPQKGAKQTYQGHQYVFDGQQWVRQ